MPQYAVVKYLNYRKNMTFETLRVAKSRSVACEMARAYATQQAEADGTEVVDHVDDDWLEIQGCEGKFTSGSGYDTYVWAVFALPECE